MTMVKMSGLFTQERSNLWLQKVIEILMGMNSMSKRHTLLVIGLINHKVIMYSTIIKAVGNQLISNKKVFAYVILLYICGIMILLIIIMPWHLQKHTVTLRFLQCSLLIYILIILGGVGKNIILIQSHAGNLLCLSCLQNLYYDFNRYVFKFLLSYFYLN